MDYERYEKYNDRLDFLESCIARLSVHRVITENKLFESQKIGFRMAKKLSKEELEEAKKKYPNGNPYLGIAGKGRPKGSKNKRDLELAKRIEWVLELLEETIEDDINALKPAERARMWEALQEYIRPKLQRSEIRADINEGPKKIGFVDESDT